MQNMSLPFTLGCLEELWLITLSEGVIFRTVLSELKPKLGARADPMQIFLDKLHYFQSILDGETAGLDNYKFALIFQKKGSAIAEIGVNVDSVWDAHLPALIVPGLWILSHHARCFACVEHCTVKSAVVLQRN